MNVLVLKMKYVNIFTIFFRISLAICRLICYTDVHRGDEMRRRQQPLGNRNIVGAKIEQRRRELRLKQRDLLESLKTEGVEMNASGLSKLEGQTRAVTDMELRSLSLALDVSVNWLLDLD